MPVARGRKGVRQEMRKFKEGKLHSGSKTGPVVTNPGTRDWSVIASMFATLNDTYGDRTICGIGRGD